MLVKAKNLGRLLLTLGLVVGLGCTGRDRQGPTKEELRIGMSQEFENLNPLIASMVATIYLNAMTGRTLATLDQNGKKISQLATEIPSFENGQARFINDKKQIEADWTIKPEAKWGDGTPLTCSDFAFARTVALNNNVSIGERETYNLVSSITWPKDNPKKCLITYRRARWDFDRMFRFYPIPKHLEEPVFEKHKDEPGAYEKNSTYTINPSNPGLYNGPYILKELKLGSHITFVPNPYFYGKKPFFQKIVAKLVPNTATLEVNLRSGTIDFISILGLTFDQALALDKRTKAENMPFDVNFKPSLVYEHIDFNLDNEKLQDQRVRQAFVYALDREDLTTSLFEGRQKPAFHNVAPIDPWYTEDPKKITVYEADPMKARKLLQEAGWVKGADGIREKNGEKLSFSLMTTAGNKVRELVQVYLKDKWQNVGIEVTIKNEPPRVLFGETTRKRKFPGLVMYAWISSPESVPRSTLHSESIPSSSNGWSGQNQPGWKNPEVDKLIEDLEIEFSFEKRKDIVSKILKHYTDDVPVIPLYYRSDISVTPKNLKGYSLTGHQYPPTNHVEDWHLVETKEN